MTYFNIFTTRDYADSNGAKNTTWYKAGYLKMTEKGGRFIRMYHRPDVTYYVFPAEKEDLPEIQIDDKE